MKKFIQILALPLGYQGEQFTNSLIQFFKICQILLFNKLYNTLFPFLNPDSTDINKFSLCSSSPLSLYFLHFSLDSPTPGRKGRSIALASGDS